MDSASTSTAPVTSSNTVTTAGNDRGHVSNNETPQADTGLEIQGEKEGITENAEKPAPKPKVKKKFVVDKKEVELELDDAETDKYIQKALAADKRFNETRKREQELDKIAAQVSQRRQEAEQFWAALDDDKSAQDLLIKKMGPERFRQLAESFLAPVVQDEILKEKNPLEFERNLYKKKAEAYEKEQAQRAEAEKKAKYEQEVNELKTKSASEYEAAIVKALESGFIPNNERSVSHFVDYMRKLVERGQEVTEDSFNHIARNIKEDKIDDIRWLVSGFSQKAKQAIEAKDDNTLVKIGDELKAMFGEDMVNLIRRSDLAKIRAGQPNIPKPIFETPRVDNRPENKGYMSEDEYKEQRRKIAMQIDAAAKKGV